MTWQRHYFCPFFVDEQKDIEIISRYIYVYIDIFMIDRRAKKMLKTSLKAHCEPKLNVAVSTRWLIRAAPLVFELGIIEMKKLVFVAVAGALALSACQNKDEEAVKNTGDAAEDYMEGQADEMKQAGDEAGAKQMEAEAQGAKDASREIAKDVGDGTKSVEEGISEAAQPAMDAAEASQ